MYTNVRMNSSINYFNFSIKMFKISKAEISPSYLPFLFLSLSSHFLSLSLFFLYNWNERMSSHDENIQKTTKNNKAMNRDIVINRSK